jgi:hypothetical protein
LLADQERVLSPDHPSTLATRYSLAHGRGETGDAVGAAAAFEELLTHMARVLSDDHPSIHSAQRALAYWREKAGARLLIYRPIDEQDR